MTQILKPLRVQKVYEPRWPWERAVWEFVSDFVVRSRVLNTTIVVARGRRTDFASVPRLPLTYAVAGDTAHEAASVHDQLYDLRFVETPTGQLPVTRKQADAVFYEIAVAAGTPCWRAWLMWVHLRWWGWLPWRVMRRGEKRPAVFTQRIQRAVKRTKR